MKKAVASLLFIAAAASLHAGSFGGPPPFTNDSPLPTGVDGSYQATARGANVTGIFRFTYSGGSQTTNPEFLANGAVFVDTYNDYIFWVDGFAYRGLVQANINGGSIAGVLDNGGANVPNTSPSGPGYLTIFTFMSGDFTGNAETDSPNFSFKGKGGLDAYTYDATPTITGQTHYTFKFKGIRNSTPDTAS